MSGFIFPYRSKILNKQEVNHNVIRLEIQKPFGYTFRPGQAIDLSIDQPGYELEVAPFTITNTTENPFLELFIKISPFKNSLTKSLAQLATGTVLQITEPWDTFQYKGAGVFIAAGSGITPFLPIFKELVGSKKELKDHKLFYANKLQEDILFQSELKRLLGQNYINVLSGSNGRNMVSGRINSDFLNERISNLNQYFYICGPRKFEQDIKKSLTRLGVKKRYIQTGYKF